MKLWHQSPIYSDHGQNDGVEYDFPNGFLTSTHAFMADVLPRFQRGIKKYFNEVKWYVILMHSYSHFAGSTV